MVRSENLLADGRWVSTLRSGLPVRLHYRLEIWRSRGGWLAGDGPGQVPVNKIPSFHEWNVDVGVGLDAGAIGAYLAKGLDDGESVKFVVRLQRRF